jgi:sugar phosphate isomerase/epimerase
MVTRDPSTQEPDVPARLAGERGLKIGSVHGPFLILTKLVWGADPLAKIRRGVEMCKALGAQSLIVHPPHLWEQGYANWIRNELIDFSAEQGVAVAVETMYPKWVAGRRLRAYRWLQPEDLIGAAPIVALDTSHLAVARLDILDAYRILLPRLVQPDDCKVCGSNAYRLVRLRVAAARHPEHLPDWVHGAIATRPYGNSPKATTPARL